MRCKMGNRISTFAAESFTNKFNQVINPNDKIMFAATSWKRTHHKMGIFSGVNKNQKGEIISVKVSYPINKYVFNGKYEPTVGRRYNYQTRQYENYTYDRRLYDTIPSTGYSTLPLKRVFKIAE